MIDCATGRRAVTKHGDVPIMQENQAHDCIQHCGLDCSLGNEWHMQEGGDSNRG